jgi:hypothetical protein
MTKIFSRTILLENIIRCEDGMYILRLYIIVRDINDIFKARWFCYGFLEFEARNQNVTPLPTGVLLLALYSCFNAMPNSFKICKAWAFYCYICSNLKASPFCFQFWYKLCMYNTDSIPRLHLMLLSLYMMASHVRGSQLALLWFIVDDTWSKRRY